MSKEKTRGSYKFESTEKLVEDIRSGEMMIDGQFKGKDIVSMEQFSAYDVALVMERARLIESMNRERRATLLANREIAIPFWEPSTRTFSSFKLAAESLGARTLAIQGMWDYSSVNKGESLSDTLKTYEALGVDAIAMRHPDKEAALVAAYAVDIPVLNGGSGAFEHPTQALLDYYTILKETTHSPIDLHMVFVGDLKNGRTVHSLAKLMATMGGRMASFVSPEVVKLPRGLKKDLEEKGVHIFETDNINDVVRKGDVFYITRVQKERFESNEEYEEARKGVVVTQELVSMMDPKAVILHPLPRVGEIEESVDADSRAAYFRQVTSGVAIRRALFDLVING